MKIAVVGATGLVGQTILQVLQEEKIKADYFLFSSARSAGKRVMFMGKEHQVLELTHANIKKVKPDYALFSAGALTSKNFAPLCGDLGCTVIDNSSAFRREPTIPLVVPECNPEDVKNAASRIISNPNCSTIGVVAVLKPLEDLYKIKRVIYSTYQAVSGAGHAGIEDYYSSAKGETPKKFPHPIFNNLIPHIDSFLDNGNTKEEDKMIFETRKILHRRDLGVSATAVRVPILNCHSISVNIEFEKEPDIAEIKRVLAKSPGIVLLDNPADGVYPMPMLAHGFNEVFVGRIRLDSSRKNCINLFTASDNIRKGAAVNAVQILKLLL